MKNKLELTWVGKEERLSLEPRVFIEDDSMSYRSDTVPARHAIFENRLIYGDNLLALKALEQEFAGRIKCVFIDPPYNTGSAFSHYEDGIEHSLWLSLMRSRVELLRGLLCKEGSLWITIDDNECHYLKVICDEIFGRNNFVATCVWEKDKGGRGDADISLSHDFILVYAKDRTVWATARNLLQRTDTQLGRFRNVDSDPRGPWRQGDDGTAKSGTEKQRFEVALPSGRIVKPPAGRFWAFSAETLATAREEGRAYFGKNGNRLPIIKRYLSEVREGVAPRTWWTADEVGTNQSAKRDHLNKLLPNVEPFETPKPEGLLSRILEIATNEGDLVLDSFAGSGTTGAVAHKMGRRWIMIELGEHAHTHIIPRMRKVIDGTDPGGITESVNWQGGGGFRYFRLAPSLLEKDSWSNWVINPTYNSAMLAEAVCKLEGFRYAPSAETFWQHGQSTERDFIYVTTQTLTHDQLAEISKQVGTERSLLICCGSFKALAGEFDNLTIKKIPAAVLDKCEFGRDDYALTTAAANPAAESTDDGVEEESTEPVTA